MPKVSAHFKRRSPSGIRVAQIEFGKRDDNTKAINLAIGNISLPMHPAMTQRMHNLDKNPEFAKGMVRYSTTAGLKETNDAFLNIIASSGFDTKGLHSQITTGGSQAMGLVILGACGEAGIDHHPLLLIDAAYTNYNAFAQRLGRKTVSIRRDLQDHGKFTLPELGAIEKVILKEKPRAIVVIPYDNPTGHFYDHKTLVKLGKLAVKHDLWMISDEAYRELHYVDHDTVSIWGLTEKEVPGITGRRMSIETASKVWNACGLRIGALITDNEEFHEKAVAENTAELCSPMIDQYIMGSLAHVSHEKLKKWYAKQREYYGGMLKSFGDEMKAAVPNIIVSSPDAAVYSVVDVRNVVKPGFDAMEFVMYCAQKGSVDVDGKPTTLLVAPMAGFYNVAKGEKNPGKTQMRIAFVETPQVMKKVPKLFADLLSKYEEMRE